MKLAVKHNLLVFDPERDDVRQIESGLVLPIAEHKTRKRKPTIEQVLAETGWRFDLPTVCKVNGVYYGRAEWATHKLTANDNVEFISRPLGGNSGGGNSTAKSIGAIVAMVALTALAPYAMAAIGLTGIAASIGSSLLIAGGAMAISHFLKPKAGGKTEAKEELYSFGFGGNQARPLQPIPVLYGRTLSFPDFAAPKYSEFDGDNMTEYALLCLGCGSYDIEELRIADTRIWTKSGGYNPSFPGIRIQICDPGEKVTLFPVNVVTATEVSGLELSTTYTPGYTANAAGTKATQLLFDFVFPGGLADTYKGELHPNAVHVVAQARLVNDAGAPVGSWETVFDKTYTYAKTSQIRITERVTVPPGRYEVRVRRTDPKLEGTTSNNGKVTTVDNIVWSALRAQIDGPNAFPRVTTIAVRARAGEGLQGITNGQIGVIATRKIPVWNGSGFVTQPSRSIAWAALDIWRNADYGAGLSIDQVDFQSFYAYDQLWTSLGHTFDHVFKEPQTLDDALETILKAGRAMPAPVGDRLTIVRDEPRGIPRMMFTDYDIVKDSLTIDYTLADDDIADGIVGEYLDETTFRLAEVSSAPAGTTLAKPARVQLQGVQKRAQAAGLVRFMAAENALRRVTVSWTARAEGRLLKRGDLVVLSCEEPETWGQSAEVVAYNDTTRTLTFDHDLEWEESGNHYVEVRRRDGQPWGPVRVTRGASDRIAIVNAGDMAAEATRQGMTLADAIARSDLADRPTAAFSPGQPRTFRVLITEGTPDTDGEHIALTGVVDDPAVYDVTETGFEPLPDVPDVFSPSIPVVTTLAANVYQRGTNLILQAGWQPAKGAISYIADVSYDGGETWVRAYNDDKTTFEAIVAAAQTIRLRVAGVTASTVVGAFSIVVLTPPPLVLSGDHLIMKVQPDDLIPALARRMDSLDILLQTADLVGEARVVAEEADERGRAAITQVAQVKVTADKALAIFGTDVTAEFEQTGVTVGERFTAVADVTGQLIGAWKVTLDSNGFFGGLQLVGANGPGGLQSELKIAVDDFLVGAPGSGFGEEAVFAINTRNGVARVTMRGDFIADGSISANQINVASLGAVSAIIGTVSSSSDVTTVGGFRLDGPNRRIEVWD